MNFLWNFAIVGTQNPSVATDNCLERSVAELLCTAGMRTLFIETCARYITRQEDIGIVPRVNGAVRGSRAPLFSRA
jgi:hypothetical protein